MTITPRSPSTFDFVVLLGCGSVFVLVAIVGLVAVACGWLS